MSRNKNDSSHFDRARDELFSHINRCGVLKATAEQQREWMDDTMDYMVERYPDLTQEEQDELRQIGLRFCQPVITHDQDGGATEEEGKDESAGAGAAAA